MAFFNTGLVASAVDGLGKGLVTGIQADMATATQEYNNTMRKIGAAQQLNAQTIQGAQLQDKASRLDTTLQLRSIEDMGAAEVSAAAAGVAGGSVQQALLGLRRSSLNAQNARMRNLDSQLFAVEQQKKNINLSTIAGEDVSIIQRPSPASSLLGLGATLLNKYDSNLPEGLQAKDGARLF